MKLIGLNMNFNHIGRKRFLKLFWALIFHILQGNSNIIVCHLKETLASQMEALIGQQIQKYRLKIKVTVLYNCGRIFFILSFFFL